jgi:hypothetical protein
LVGLGPFSRMTTPGWEEVRILIDLCKDDFCRLMVQRKERWC